MPDIETARSKKRYKNKTKQKKLSQNKVDKEKQLNLS